MDLHKRYCSSDNRIKLVVSSVRRIDIRLLDGVHTNNLVTLQNCKKIFAMLFCLC